MGKNQNFNVNPIAYLIHLFLIIEFLMINLKPDEILL
tara:strand:+ start:726 stop:836 length:111 start_codon:yes stop_codon:yes gene_type:complete